MSTCTKTFISVLVLTIAFGAFCALQTALKATPSMTIGHALERHPTDAAVALTAVAQNKVLVEAVQSDTGYIAKVCQPEMFAKKNKFGVVICDPSPQHVDGIVTAFSNKGPQIKDVLTYLVHRGYSVVAMIFGGIVVLSMLITKILG